MTVSTDYNDCCKFRQLSAESNKCASATRPPEATTHLKNVHGVSPQQDTDEEEEEGALGVARGAEDDGPETQGTHFCSA